MIFKCKLTILIVNKLLYRRKDLHLDECTEKLLETTVKETIQSIYQDTLSPALKEVGQIALDAVKTIKLVTAPIQYGAYLQTRLEQHLEKSLKDIPKEKLVNPHDSIQIPIFEQLKNYDKDEQNNEAIIAEMYQNLLSSAYNKDTSPLVHPRFSKIISDLSPDEGLLFQNIGSHKNKYVFFIGDLNERKLYIKANNFKSIFRDEIIPENKKINRNDIYTNYNAIGINLDNLKTPEYSGMYIDNLQKLGLIRFEPSSSKSFKISEKGLERFSVDGQIYNLSDFGQLLFNLVSKKI